MSKDRPHSLVGRSETMKQNWIGFKSWFWHVFFFNLNSPRVFGFLICKVEVMIPISGGCWEDYMKKQLCEGQGDCPAIVSLQVLLVMILRFAQSASTSVFWCSEFLDVRYISWNFTSDFNVNFLRKGIFFCIIIVYLSTSVNLILMQSFATHFPVLLIVSEMLLIDPSSKGSNLGSGIAFSCHVSLGSFKVGPFHSVSLSFITLFYLKYCAIYVLLMLLMITQSRSCLIFLLPVYSYFPLQLINTMGMGRYFWNMKRWLSL